MTSPCRQTASGLGALTLALSRGSAAEGVLAERGALLDRAKRAGCRYFELTPPAPSTIVRTVLMPAITVGVAEVEERLRQLRRRLNSRTVLHVGSIGLSIVLLVAAALLALALRGSMLLFRPAVWSGLAVILATMATCLMATRRRWMSL